MSKTLLYRAIITPDGTILESRHTHDYKRHFDMVSKEEYMIDGGLSYFRTNINTVKPTVVELYDTDNIIILREYITRGTFDKDGNRILKLIKDCSNAHLENIIEYNKQFNNNLSDTFSDLCKRELQFREENNIYIEDEK